MSFVVRVIVHAVRITVRAQSSQLTRAVKEAKEDTTAATTESA